MGIQESGDAFAGVFESLPRLPAESMAAGGVAGPIAQIGLHCFPDRGKHGRTGVIVEVDRAHDREQPTGRQGDGVPCTFPGFILLRILWLFAGPWAHEEKVDPDDQAGAAQCHHVDGKFHDVPPDKVKKISREQP